MFKFRFICLLMVLLLSNSVLAAAANIQGQLAQLKKERLELAQTRHALENQLGGLNRQLRVLDQAWVKAKQALDAVQKEERSVRSKVTALKKKIQQLTTTIHTIKERMQQESSAVWRQAGRSPSWLDVLAGTPVTEIPHRQYMLASVVKQQQYDRTKLQNSIKNLQVAQATLQDKQQALTQLRQQKKQVAQIAKQQLRAKRNLARKVRSNVHLKKDRDATLALQQKGLIGLLKRIEHQIEARKKAAKKHGKPDKKGRVVIPIPYNITGNIRKHRGNIPWPLRGKLVAHYGARLDQNRPKLKGVLIAPASNSKRGRKVRAIANGVVRYADWFGGFGLMMIVEHGGGVMSIYAHNDAMYKKIGDRVKAGDIVSDAGSTGWIERVRLYFEMRVSGHVTNPEKWCRG
ncbi:MAG: peptidoglycan DD-metalloendopeptidase family protein [Mariprofundaceae bacterium]|nr:peptidoglycan DD-metalloendopeptidase family protein [Mariprofundaceae bacterium]